MISRYSPVYFHYEVSGGPPEGSFYLKTVAVYPDGSTYSSQADYLSYDGSTGRWGWSGSIYNNPAYGRTGTLTMKFYDDSGNLIGSGSVTIY